MNSLLVISPIDGRYHDKTKGLVDYFSESAIIKNRLIVEIEYLISLREVIPKVDSLMSDSLINVLRNIQINVLKNAIDIKRMESRINHDVKAIEYFLADKLRAFGVPELVNFIHFGLTSQDVCSVALSKTLNDCYKNFLVPLLSIDLEGSLGALARRCSGVVMLSRTHGQPASPTCLRKEIDVFVYRLNQEVNSFIGTTFAAKFGGAVGNFNAHVVAYPDVDWRQFATNFLKKFSLSRSLVTTQVDNNDIIVKFFDHIKRINNILIDFCRDIWLYVSMNYFKLAINNNEVGSSTMPHKVNPIDFENAEGNLGLANAIFDHINSRIQISRLQRDLTDSTILRNVGVPLAHSVLSYYSIINGVAKLDFNVDAITKDLENNWVVVAEGIQTILRRDGFNNAYEELKLFTRTGCNITESDISNFIINLNVPDELKSELLKITPFNYVGISDDRS